MAAVHRLADMREAQLQGELPIRIEEDQFRLSDHQRFLDDERCPRPPGR